MKEGDWSEDKMKNPGKQMRSVWSINNTEERRKVTRQTPDTKTIRST